MRTVWGLYKGPVPVYSTSLIVCAAMGLLCGGTIILSQCRYSKRRQTMQFGVFLPISGRATGPDTLMEAARSAEEQGFDALWSADRVVTPWQINTSYPYSENQDRK